MRDNLKDVKKKEYSKQNDNKKKQSVITLIIIKIKQLRSMKKRYRK